MYIFDWEISRMMGRCPERSYNFNPLDLRSHTEGTVNPTAVNAEVAEGRKRRIRICLQFVVVRTVICNPGMREKYTLSCEWVHT
jgi:hypothetical protein